MARIAWPRSLFGRVVLVLFVGLLAAQALSFLLVLAERSLAMRGMMVSYLASDVASSVAVLERLPADKREAWLPRFERRNYRFALRDVSRAASIPSTVAEAVQREVRKSLRRDDVNVIAQASGGMHVQVRLSDGTPLAVLIDEPRVVISPWAWAGLAVQLLVLAAAGAFAVRVVTRPLEQLALAADAIQPGGAAAALPQDGPQEVARTARAFEAMQERIRAHLDERMHILAAVSHDLQTPITRLRLRADLLEDATLREKLHADLFEMQSLVEEGISYARSAHAAREQARTLDLRDFLESLVFDYADAGRPVTLAGCESMRIDTRPQALRRLVCNLVDNALKFAGAAEVAAYQGADAGLVIEVLDRGPGIPPEHREAVLLPFARLESSRNRNTGGTGLGLAIAHQLAQALGGRLELATRDGGGLAARAVLPSPEWIKSRLSKAYC